MALLLGKHSVTVISYQRCIPVAAIDCGSHLLLEQGNQALRCRCQDPLNREPHAVEQSEWRFDDSGGGKRVRGKLVAYRAPGQYGIRSPGSRQCLERRQRVDFVAES